MISRRSFLTALGLGTGSLFLPSLRGRGVAHAGPTDPPKRLIVIGTGHGTVHENWNMRPPGVTVTDISDWEFPLTTPGLAFSRILTPFAPLAAKTLVIEGLANYSAIAAGGNAHDSGFISAFTGTMPRDVGGGVLTATAASLDQIVAKQIARPDRIPSIEVGNMYRGMFYDEQGISLPGEYYPSALFERLFGKPVAASGDDDLVRANQSSVLDVVAAQYASLAPRLSGDDRQKLAQHRELVRDLEKRISGLAALQCNVPAAPGPIDYAAESGAYKASFDAFAALVVAAFSCDVTRVAAFQIGGPNCADMGAPPGDIHQLYAHHADDAPEKTPDGIEFMTRYHTYDATLVASLATALDAVPEGAGTMLDNTLILWGGELGSGGHFLGRLPLVLIGNTGGKFKTGRYVHYGQRFPIPNGGHDNREMLGPPHAKLLTAIAQAFDVNIGVVGLPEVTLQGRSVPVSGALERLS